MILCTFCAIAIFSSAQGKFSIKGNAGEKWNNQLLYLCLMDDGEKAKEVVKDAVNSVIDKTIDKLNEPAKESSLFLVYVRHRILHLLRIGMEKLIR